MIGNATTTPRCGGGVTNGAWTRGPDRGPDVRLGPKSPFCKRNPNDARSIRDIWGMYRGGLEDIRPSYLLKALRILGDAIPNEWMTVLWEELVEVGGDGIYYLIDANGVLHNVLDPAEAGYLTPEVAEAWYHTLTVTGVPNVD